MDQEEMDRRWLASMQKTVNEVLCSVSEDPNDDDRLIALYASEIKRYMGLEVFNQWIRDTVDADEIERAIKRFKKARHKG